MAISNKDHTELVKNLVCDNIDEVKHPICPLNLYFEGDEDKCDGSKCDYGVDNIRGCSLACEREKMDNVGGIKIESGEKRQFDTGAKKQASTGKGTPVLFPPDAYLEISKHFEDGAAVYSARNWEKGIPLSELINSCERHIAQEKMGLTDECHDRALAWCAVVYLATKLRIHAGILPKELDDLCGAYEKKQNKILNEPYQGHGRKNIFCKECEEKIQNAKDGELILICEKCAHPSG